MAYNQDKQIRNMRIGIGAALVAGLSVVGFQLKEAFDDMAQAKTDRDAVITDIIQGVQALKSEREALSREIEAYSKGEPLPSASGDTEPEALPDLELCNNYYFRSFRPCTNIELHDGTVVRVEEGSASQYLIETVDGLRSGEMESMIEEPLPIEESDPMMLYDFTG